jgi:hypothetical protein
MLFWPYRDLYSNRRRPAELVRRRFEQGERLLRQPGPNVRSDYKVLVFRAGTSAPPDGSPE